MTFDHHGLPIWIDWCWSPERGKVSSALWNSRYSRRHCISPCPQKALTKNWPWPAIPRFPHTSANRWSSESRFTARICSRLLFCFPPDSSRLLLSLLEPLVNTCNRRLSTGIAPVRLRSYIVGVRLFGLLLL